jgi:arylsulfatase A-like enzyme
MNGCQSNCSRALLLPIVITKFSILTLLALPALCPAAPRPNVLFIMADDHTTQALGCYGSRLAGLNPTPTLDKFAAEGMRFDRVFCTNAICTPSRASILTGQYPRTNGVLDLDGSLDANNQHLASEMKAAGYETAMIGKWHLMKEPAAFDHYCVLPGQGSYFNPTFRVRGGKAWPGNTIQKQGHSTDVITDLTLEWLKSGRNKDNPFFLMHHYKAPHDLFQNAPRYDDYLSDVKIPEPDTLWNQPGPRAGSIATRGKDDQLVSQIGAGVTLRCNTWRLGQKLGVQAGQDPEFGRETYQRYLKRYLRCVKGIDDNLERLFAYLREEGLYDNTIIIYTGDQGFFLGEHDLMDKRWMYEEALRMPFIVRYPPIVKPKSTSQWIVNNTDFAPTILELAGKETPAYMQGRSFVRALHGDDPPADWRKATYYRYWMHMAHNLGTPAHFGVRSDHHKLIFFYGTDTKPGSSKDTPAAWEFYDLEKDPSEMNNEYGNPEYAKVIARLKTELKSQRDALHETDADFPHIQTIVNKHWNE